MILFVAVLFLSIYNTGCMTALQLQHYGIYPAVGRDGFAEYLKANNRAAAVPTILPAMLLLLSSIGLVIFRPVFVRSYDAWAILALNLAALFSTFRWQRKLQSEMAGTGYDEAKVRLLIWTNWIRTISYWCLAIIVIRIVVGVLETAGVR